VDAAGRKLAMRFVRGELKLRSLPRPVACSACCASCPLPNRLDPRPGARTIPSMDLLLENKVVLITGASGGIGRALAEAFAGEEPASRCSASAVARTAGVVGRAAVARARRHAGPT